MIMGVLNVTPDSFSDGGRHLDVDLACARALEMVAEGADIIDVGGESTRPGALEISVDEEAGRVIPVLAALRDRVPVPISVDTYKAAVASQALAAGASIVNDISGLTLDSALAGVVAAAGGGLVIGHIQGVPRTMQRQPSYDDVVAEVASALARSIEIALAAGVAADAIVVDPGLGFGKLFEHNLALLRGLGDVAALGHPVAVGLSRKSFTGQPDGVPPAERLPATLAATALAVAWGADIVRVHDVIETRRALYLVDRMLGRA